MKINPRLSKIGPVILLLFFFCSLQVLAQSKENYTVQQGETLYSISKKLKVTIAELRQWNNLSGTDISVGQTLVYYPQKDETEQTKSPSEEPSAPLVNKAAGADNAYYIVKSGDTLYGISKEHGMTINQLKSLNNLTSDALRVGQKLTVRKLAEAPPSVAAFSEESSPQGVFSIYKVKKNETLTRLLSRFRMSEAVFHKLNPELNIQSLSAGQEVTVLLPPSRNYKNPFLQKANLQDLGEVHASVYGKNEVGETTTNGELYDPQALTAAHSNIALGSVIFVVNPTTGSGVYVRVNDRITGSGLKLSGKAFSTLGLNETAKPTVTIYTETND
jgi:LysM repeat protein